LGIIIPIDELIFFRGVGIPSERKDLRASSLFATGISKPILMGFELPSGKHTNCHLVR